MKLKEKILKSDFAYGTWSQTGSPEVLEILGYSGKFAFTIIDTEHGFYDLGAAENLVRAANASRISPIVRVMANENHLITKALDIGAEGILVPQITTRAEAEKVVAATKYYPKGNRGACPFIRVGHHLVTDWAEYATKANEDVLVMVLVEGETGIRNLPEIAKTEGLDAIMLGPMDLSVSLGIGGQLDHPKVVEHIAQTIKVCDQENVSFFLPNFHLDMHQAAESIKKWRSVGCKYFTVGSDKMFLTNYMNLQHQLIRGE